MRRRTAFNPKRTVCEPAEAERLIQSLLDAHLTPVYTGNPEHKRAPGDFALFPPAYARPHKTLCDSVGITRREEAQRYLHLGFTRGLFSRQLRDGWPQNIWAVTDDGYPLESQHEGAGRYHGYPMPEGDPFRDEILSRWNKA